MMARLVRALVGFHPRSIAIDIAFLNPRDADLDAKLAGALQEGPAVVAAIGNFDAVGPANATAQPGDLALAPRPSSVLWPIDLIRDAAQVGLANVSTDKSGVPRYIPMIYETPVGVVPSFALAAASQGLRRTGSLRSVSDRDRGTVESDGSRLSHAVALLWAQGKFQAHQRG